MLIARTTGYCGWCFLCHLDLCRALQSYLYITELRSTVAAIDPAQDRLRGQKGAHKALYLVIAGQDSWQMSPLSRWQLCANDDSGLQ